MKTLQKREALKKARVNCEGCSHRCRYSLQSPFNTECLLADCVASTGRKEQLQIREIMKGINIKLNRKEENE